ncbi:MAG: hypothetical protein WCX73_01840 [Candidatus Pacearchaeota archaeon]|jgi:hypothetical protein
MTLEDYIPFLLENPLTLFRYYRMGHHLEKFVEYNEKIGELNKQIEKNQITLEKADAKAKNYSKKAIRHGVKAINLGKILDTPIPNETDFYKAMSGVTITNIMLNSEERYKQRGLNLNEKVNGRVREKAR